MRLVKRAAIMVTPKQPYLDWANGMDEDGVKIGEDFWPERHVYLIGDVSDIIPFDRDVITRPYFKAIFEEELNSWYRLESGWPRIPKKPHLLYWAGRVSPSEMHPHRVHHSGRTKTLVKKGERL